MQETNTGSVVILIDSFTRETVKEITYDAIAKHASVVTDIRELGDIHYGADFVFFESSVPAVVTPEVLAQQVEAYNIKPHFIYNIDSIGELFEDLAHTVKANYSTLEWNLIYAVIHEDSAILEPYQKAPMDILEFSEIVKGLPAEVEDPVNRLYQSYIALAHGLRQSITENSEQKETIELYKSLGRKTTKALNEMKDLLGEVQQHNQALTAMLADDYDKVFTGVYPDRPRVLYIRQVSHLAGVDNLIAVLYSVITKQYKLSAKVVKLVDSSNALCLRYVPNIYVPLSDTYDTADVLSNDFVTALSGYQVLFSLLMLNRSGLDLLIVHDMRSAERCAIDDSLIDLKLHEISSDYVVLNEFDNALSDVDPKSPFYWNNQECVKYTGSNSIKLANHPTIGNIVSLLM